MARKKQDVSPNDAIETIKAAMVGKIPKGSSTGVLVISTDGALDVNDIIFGKITAERVANAIVLGAMQRPRYREVLSEIMARVQALPPELTPAPPHVNAKIFAYIEALVRSGYPVDDLLGALMAVAAKYAKQPAEGKCAGGVQQCRSCFMDTADEAYGNERTVEPKNVN